MNFFNKRTYDSIALLKTSPPTASKTTSAPFPLLAFDTSSFKSLSFIYVNAAHAPFSRTSVALSSVPQTPITYKTKFTVNLSLDATIWFTGTFKKQKY